MQVQQILQKFDELFQVAQQKYPQANLKKPAVVFTTKGKAAGRAWKNGSKVEFNTIIAKNATETNQDFTNTISHELAHIVQYALNPQSKPHGVEFKKIHRSLGGTGETYHQYSVQGVTGLRTVKRYSWVCDCKTHEVTAHKNKKMLGGMQWGCFYRCSACGSKVLPKDFI